MDITVESVREMIRFSRGVVVESAMYPGQPVVVQMGKASVAEAQALYDHAVAVAQGNMHQAAEIVRSHVGVGMA